MKALEVALPGARALFTTREGGRGHELARQLGLELAWVRQVHGSEVLTVTEPNDPRTDAAEADGLATDVPGLAVAVVTADCVPIALAGGGSVAMLHAGWRGLARGVIGAGVRQLRALARDGEPVEAAIGPHARACCYEVGEEVHRRFAGRATARRGTHLDMAAIARSQLEAAGVVRVHDIGACTICDPEARFYSYRRDPGTPDRQAGIAWLS